MATSYKININTYFYSKILLSNQKSIMKTKTILSVLFLSVTSIISHAQQAFQKGDNVVAKLDLYGWVMLSCNFLKFSNTACKSDGSDAGLTAYVGGHYFFTNNIAAFAELGYGVSYLTLGAALKF